MRGPVEREHRIGDLSPRATPPREFPESDGGGACTPHVIPAASARCPPDPEYLTPRREIGIPEGVGLCQWGSVGVCGVMGSLSLVGSCAGRALSRSRGARLAVGQPGGAWP
jgi:hypothetical protein